MYLIIILPILESEIPSVSNSPMEYLNNPVCNSLYIFPVTCNEIETDLSRLKTGKSVGPFSIPIDILKVLKAYVSRPLEIVFNASFSTGVVPRDFKIANIVPVFKKDHSHPCAITVLSPSFLSLVSSYKNLYIRD